MSNKIEKVILKDVVFINKKAKLQSYEVVDNSSSLDVSLCFETPKNNNIDYEIKGGLNLTSEDGGNKIFFEKGKTFFEISLTSQNVDMFLDFLEKEGLDVDDIRERFYDFDFRYCKKELKAIFELLKINKKILNWNECDLILDSGDLVWEKYQNDREFENTSLAKDGSVVFVYIDFDVIKALEDYDEECEEQLKEEKEDDVDLFERTKKYLIKEEHSNANLAISKKAKNDEFYTQLSDIEEELEHYKKFFKGRTIYCNCDNPKVSNFCKFFLDNFKELGLKRLICTCLAPESYTRGFVLDTNLSKTKIYELNGTGDFRTPECIEYLKQADIVVTNPPFSIIREFINLMNKNNKYFLIIGTQMCLAYKDVFPYVKEGQIKTGYNNVNYFITQDGELSERFGNIYWITNLPIEKEIEPLVLSKTYNPIDYPKYENHDAIEVSRLKDIPYDFQGVMGVPITFILKYNPKQFEIVGMTSDAVIRQPDDTLKKVFKRIFVRNKNPVKKMERRIKDFDCFLFFER